MIKPFWRIVSGSIFKGPFVGFRFRSKCRGRFHLGASSKLRNQMREREREHVVTCRIKCGGLKNHKCPRKPTCWWLSSFQECKKDIFQCMAILLLLHFFCCCIRKESKGLMKGYENMFLIGCQSLNPQTRVLWAQDCGRIVVCFVFVW